MRCHILLLPASEVLAIFIYYSLFLSSLKKKKICLFLSLFVHSHIFTPLPKMWIVAKKKEHLQRASVIISKDVENRGVAGEGGYKGIKWRRGVEGG